MSNINIKKYPSIYNFNNVYDLPQDVKDILICYRGSSTERLHTLYEEVVQSVMNIGYTRQLSEKFVYIYFGFEMLDIVEIKSQESIKNILNLISEASKLLPSDKKRVIKESPEIITLIENSGENNETNLKSL